MKNRIMSIVVMAIVLCFAIFPAPVSATTYTINSFGKNTVLTHTQYDMLRSGKISAVKKNGVWYYQFAKGGNKLLVKATAFSGKVDNNFSSVDKSLTKGVTKTNGIAEKCGYAFKARTYTGTTRVQPYGKNTTLNPVAKKTYTTYISWLTIVGNRVGTEIDFDCKKNGHVQFSFSDKVYVTPTGKLKSGYKAGYKAPSNAKEYVAALSRTTNNNVSTAMVPTFRLEITKPGTNCVRLNSCIYHGKGIADTKTPITKYIDVALAAASVGKDMATEKLRFESLYKLYSQATTSFVKRSEEYVSNQKIYLSWNKKYTMKGKFKSPIKIKQNNDYFRTETRLSKAPSVKGTKTQMKVAFSVTWKNVTSLY